MAGGFAAGLFQGALVSGAGLVVLSLALPQPPRPVAPPDPVTPALHSAEPAGESLAALPEPPPPPPPPASQAELAPAPISTEPGLVGAAPDVPPQSEFARGVDSPPSAPAAIDAPATRPADAPAVSLPADEAYPVSADSTPQPDMAGDAPVAPAPAVRDTESAGLPPLAGAPPAAPRPTPAALPGVDMTPDVVGTVAAVDDPASPATTTTSGFDLSTPPDFGALRLSDPN